MSGIATMLLAAGGSRRFGADSKLMADLGGRPVVDHAAQAVAETTAAHRIAVVRPGPDPMRALLAARGFALVDNPRAEEGMGASISAGTAYAAEHAATGLLVCLADAPLIRSLTLSVMMDAFAARKNAGAIVVARDARRRGAPVVFGAAHFPALMALEGDEGGRALLAAHADMVTEVATSRPDELDDVDTPAALAAVRERLKG